ncbi:hypothetical protein [Domibacillus iocasae]|uniref:hypothetical protein n=1 Tax=Domibacillus iocasae TaxID=1714016 RepID=UPI001471203A|nr:hypothetical protein [Domibacillus iocasae]
MAVYKIDGKEYEVDSTVKAHMDAQDARSSFKKNFGLKVIFINIRLLYIMKNKNR